jgi:hypothetical protein
MSIDAVRIAASIDRIYALGEVNIECYAGPGARYQSVIAYTDDGIVTTVGTGSTQVEAFEDAAQWAEDQQYERECIAALVAAEPPREDEDFVARLASGITCAYTVSPEDDLPLVAYREYAVHV